MKLLRLFGLSSSKLTGSQPALPATDVLLVSGFGWSGSGALIDYASCYSGVGGFRRNFEEGSVLKGLYSLAEFYRACEGMQKTEQDIDRLVEALAGGPGLAERIKPKREYINIKRNEHMRRELGGDRIDEAVGRLAKQLKDRLNSAGVFRGSADDVLQAGREYVMELKRIVLQVRFKTPPAHLILNNDPPGYSVDLFQFHAPARYTIVTRDLLDVFATLLALKRIGIDEKSVREFVRAQSQKLVKFENTLKRAAPEIRQSSVLVDFSDFVSIESVREDWHAFCGLSREKVSDKFKPDESRKNVGVGATLPREVHAMILDGVERKRRDLMEKLRREDVVPVLGR